MSSSQSQASKQALEQNKSLAEGYYRIALPALSTRIGSINQSLGLGEPEFLKQGYQQQRLGLTEGLAARGGVAQAQQMAGAKGALSGGNAFASLHPADIGAQLANALYGSKFQEGQGALDQQFNLISMGLGGAGTAGNAALNASGQELNAIRYLPQYNTTYANIAGGAALGAGLYGGYQNWLSTQPGLQPGATLPTGWSSAGVVP